MQIEQPNVRTALLEHAFFRFMRWSGFTFAGGMFFQALGTGGVADKAYDWAFIAMVLYLISVVLARYGK
jgi:hypothetical protein